MAGVFIARTPTFFFLLSPWIESFVAPLQIAILWLPWVPSRAQLANELLSNLHHAAAARAQHECMRSTAVDLSYSVRCWIDGLQHYVWRSKVRPHDQDSALLQNSSRENARRAALSVLCAKSEHACESLRFAWSSGDLRWGIDERKQRWRRRRSRKGKNSWWGHFCEIMRQRNEKGLQSTTRKDLRRAKTKRHNVPDSRRALHMHVLERDFGIRAACMQHDCATCASMLRDAVTAAQSRFLATLILFDRVQASRGCPRRSWTELNQRDRRVVSCLYMRQVVVPTLHLLMVTSVRSACHLHSCWLWPSLHLPSLMFKHSLQLGAPLVLAFLRSLYIIYKLYSSSGTECFTMLRCERDGAHCEGNYRNAQVELRASRRAFKSKQKSIAALSRLSRARFPWHSDQCQAATCRQKQTWFRCIA